MESSLLGVMYLQKKHTNLILSSVLKKDKVTYCTDVFTCLICHYYSCFFNDVIVHAFNNTFYSIYIYTESVFEKTTPYAISVLDGFNVCIFAYGQTGTGKTFTMEGIEGARGVNYRTLEELFRIIKEREGTFLYEITVSVLEVYNEQIHDLLMTGSQPGATTKRYSSTHELCYCISNLNPLMIL
jgi:hypothetical protein